MPRLRTAAATILVLSLACAESRAHPGIRHDIDRLTALIAGDPANGPLYLERASRERIAGELDEALVDLERAVALGVVDSRIDLEAGLTLAARGCVAEAEAALTRHLESTAGGSAAAFLARARVRARTGRVDEAAHDLTGALALWPDPETYLELGALYEGTGRNEAAAATYREGFERLGGAVVLGAALTRVEEARGHAGPALVRPAKWVAQAVPASPALGGTTVTFRQGEAGYAGASDTYLEQAQPGTSFGSAATVRWDGDQPNGSGFIAYALIRFDDIVGTDPGHVPPDTTIAAATLTYSITNSGNPGEVHEALAPWQETDTFASYCGAGCDGTQIGVEVAAAPGDAIAERTVDVTASVQSIVSGAANLGWIVVPTGNDGVEFSSSQAATVASRPLLSVTWGEPVIVVRKPYLQLGTPESMTVAWRTNVATDSRVRYGTTEGVLDHEAVVPAVGIDHAVTLTGLAPATKYWYDVGSSTEVHEGGTAQHFFVTSPAVGSAAQFRAWILGDAGNGSLAQAQVRDAMLAATAADPPDLFLHMGDIAYYSGTDAEFTAYHFAPYADILRHTVLWTTLGNHEGQSTTSGSPGISTGPYYQAFVLPSAGEAGGAPSGTEAYYSFDYANVHFVCLNSYQVDRGATAAMASWLQLDLAANTQPWIIAFWHHPPYTHGSHNSDFEIEHIEMRENLLPILEAGGVDLVLGGHSHGYERSYLVDAATMTPTPDFDTLLSGGYIRDPGDGQLAGDGAYRKDPGIHPHQGAVYVVAGHGGADVGGAMDHPVMHFSEARHGSVVMDVDGDSITLTNVRRTGEVSDTFTLVKRAATCFDDAGCASQGPCRPGRCVNGSCRTPVLPDGAACDDGDECTSPDSCVTGACVGPRFVPPEIAGFRATADDAELVWDAAAPPTDSYDVVRGELAGLPVGAQSESCLVSRSGTPSVTDPDLPSASEGFWYLVRGRSACEAGDYGYEGLHGTAGNKRTSNACP